MMTRNRGQIDSIGIIIFGNAMFHQSKYFYDHDIKLSLFMFKIPDINEYNPLLYNSVQLTHLYCVRMIKLNVSVPFERQNVF